METPEHLLYSSDHEWISVEGTTARVGITDFAQSSLGDVVYVQVPAVGTIVSAGDTCSEVESTKSVSDIYAPVSGTVTAVNDALSNAPETLNSDPYGSGWIFEVELSDPGQLDGLLSASDYQSLVDG